MAVASHASSVAALGGWYCKNPAAPTMKAAAATTKAVSDGIIIASIVGLAGARQLRRAVQRCAAPWLRLCPGARRRFTDRTSTEDDRVIAFGRVRAGQQL